jgi:GH15 family glucan-1,4-alpha-glucosidase
MAQPPIEDYALLGDTRTAALSSSTGSIDWFCLPGFDGHSIFNRLVDDRAGGSFAITVPGGRPVDRRYRDRSTVVETTWATPSGEVRLTEGLVTSVSGRLLPDNLLVRRVAATGGPAEIRIRFGPKRGLPGEVPRSHGTPGRLVCSWGSVAVAVTSSPLVDLRADVDAVVTVYPSQPLTFALSHMHRAPQLLVDPGAAWDALTETDRDWCRWSAEISYDGPQADMVVRSLITLRLLTFSPSGAPVAAPTTSLPEWPGGVRNWDYRYSWPRDACIGVNAFLATGKTAEACSFMRWLLHATRLSRPRVGVMYNAYGKPAPRERDITDVSGYRNSLPVRVGNAASGQHQLDVYGWILDAAWLMTDAGQRHDRSMWRALASFADFVATHWRASDAGIWEQRGPTKQFVHSKLMAWLALDRALRLAAVYPTRRPRCMRWRAERDALAAEIRSHGFSERRKTYVRSYGDEDVDAALLLLPILEFDDPKDDRVTRSVSVIRNELGAGGPLLYRYAPGVDGLPGPEGAFLPTSFWAVQALARIGDVEAGTGLFDELCSLAGPLGLFAEEVDPATSAQLGNFPQAFTHAALVQAALALRDATSV